MREFESSPTNGNQQRMIYPIRPGFGAINNIHPDYLEQNPCVRLLQNTGRTKSSTFVLEAELGSLGRDYVLFSFRHDNVEMGYALFEK
jgi:hypothetical protein